MLFVCEIQVTFPWAAMETEKKFIALHEQILFGNCFSPSVQGSSQKHRKRLLSSIKATDRNSHHFVEYLINLNHSLSKHVGFPGCHLQGNTKPQKNIFNLKHACGSD